MALIYGGEDAWMDRGPTDVVAVDWVVVSAFFVSTAVGLFVIVTPGGARPCRLNNLHFT